MKKKHVNSALICIPVSASGKWPLLMTTWNVDVKSINTSINYMQKGYITSTGVCLSMCMNASSSGLLSDLSLAVEVASSSVVSVHYESEKILQVDCNGRSMKGKMVKYPINLFKRPSSAHDGLIQMCSVTDIEGVQCYAR